MARSKLSNKEQERLSYLENWVKALIPEEFNLFWTESIYLGEREMYREYMRLKEKAKG